MPLVLLVCHIGCRMLYLLPSLAAMWFQGPNQGWTLYLVSRDCNIKTVYQLLVLQLLNHSIIFSIIKASNALHVP